LHGTQQSLFPQDRTFLAGHDGRAVPREPGAANVASQSHGNTKYFVVNGMTQYHNSKSAWDSLKTSAGWCKGTN
jgi:hypothetical protein